MKNIIIPIVSIILYVAFVTLSTMWLKSYGYSLFLLVPVVIGFISSLFANNGEGKPSLLNAFGAALIVNIITSLLFLLLGIEGLICIIMASPLVVIGSFVGASIAYIIKFQTWKKLQKIKSIAILTIFVPVFMGMESRHITAQLRCSESTMEINAPIDVVWDKTINFSEIPPPNEFIFKYGVAYPIRAEIIREGEMLVRRCVFNTGSFIEPITDIKTNKLLKFDVVSQPVGMIELSPYNIHPAHLDGFVISKRGMFEFKKLGDKKTLLIGRTWYQVQIMPEFYWSPIINYLIQSVHYRVLNHIKIDSERTQQGDAPESVTSLDLNHINRLAGPR